MRTGQAWVFLEIGLGVVFVITLFCVCRYFDTKKVRRQRKRAKNADEDCYQRKLSEQRERAMSIRKESLIREEHEMEAKQPLNPVDEKEEKEKEVKEEKQEKPKSVTNSPAVSSKKEAPPSPKPEAAEEGKE